MRIELGTAGGTRRYWTVLVDPNELVVESGRALPYSTWIGTIDERGKVNVWSPAAYKPQGYKAAAIEMLEKARAELIASGEVKASARHVDSGYHARRLASDTASHNNYVRAYGGGKRDSFATAKEHLKLLGMSLRKKDGEYCVTFADGTSYCTDDLGDAVATAEQRGLR